MLNWINTNEGFITSIFALFSFVMSVVAIIITIKTSKTQKRIERTNINISLLEKRIEIYDYFLDVIQDIGNEMLRISKSYFDYNHKENLNFMFLPEIDFCEYPMYFNDDICYSPTYQINLRIAKSIFGNEFESVINQYTNRAVLFANTKVDFDKFIAEHGKEKFWFMFRNNKDAPEIISDEEYLLLEQFPNVSGIAEEYSMFKSDRVFEKYIEKHLDIEFV